MLCKYANDEERRAIARKRQRLRCITIVVKGAACNGAQHEEARCMTNIVQRLLENVEQHTITCAVEIERARQT